MTIKIGAILSKPLYCEMSLQSDVFKISKRLSISFVAHFIANTAFLGSTIVSVRRYGIFLYKVISTLFGSININLKSSGELFEIRVVMILCKSTDFPEPVDPVMRRCLILERSMARLAPYSSLPMLIVRFVFMG